MRIPAPHGHLEALLKEPDRPLRGAGLVCHPHPVYGGTMHTKAVYRAGQALTDAGLAALRFNFRGVGTSTGSHDGGVGEREDVRVALDWLADKYPHLPLVAGGFSFGSLVGMSAAADDERVVALLGIGLPVDLDRYDYSFLKDSDKPVLVVQGEDDEFGSGRLVAELLADFGPHITLVRIAGADHYFAERLDDLRDAIRGYYDAGPGSRYLATV